MEYNVKKLADQYSAHLFDKKKTIKKPKIARFNSSAYTDYEYLRAIKMVENDYKFCDSFALTEEFLKGENVDS